MAVQIGKMLPDTSPPVQSPSRKNFQFPVPIGLPLTFSRFFFPY